MAVTWIEARAEVMPALREHIARYPNQVAYHATLAEDAQQRTFHIADNGQSSSLYPMALHKARFPGVSMVDTVECVTTTLDALVERHGIQVADTALVMDVQGAELAVLKGAVKALGSITYIKAEAADFNSYEGGTQLDEIEAFMGAVGFERFALAECVPTEGVGNYYEVGYKRAVVVVEAGHVRTRQDRSGGGGS